MHEVIAEPGAVRSVFSAPVRLRHVIGAVVLAGALLTVMFFFYHDPHTAQVGDGHQYVTMANHLDRFAEPPFGYRIVAPAIVSSSPFSTVLGFQILTVASLVVTSALVMSHVLMLYGSPRRAAFAWVLFMCSPCVWLSLKDPYSSDPLGYVLIASAFILIWQRRWMLVALCTVLGIFVRESVAFVALPALIACWAERGSRRTLYFACLVGLPVAAYLLLHYTPLFYANRRQYDYLSIDTIRSVWNSRTASSGSGIEALVAAFYRTWGVIWLAVPYLLLRAGRASRWAALSYLLAVVGSIVFASNWLRMLAFAFPVMIALISAVNFSAVTAAAFLVPYAVLSLVLAGQRGSGGKYFAEAAMLCVSGVALLYALVRRVPPAPAVVVESPARLGVP